MGSPGTRVANMWSRNLLVLWMCGLRILCPVLSSQNSAIRYSYETNQNDAKNLNILTDFVPLYSESDRFKRDTSSVLSSESEETTTTANKIYINENKNKSEANGGLTDDFLKNQVFQQNKTEKDDVKTTHKDYSFDNDTLHKYYMHTIVQGKDYFYDLDRHNFSGPNMGKVKEHDMLSQSYRRAATINLSFKFPFYGHLVPNITIATGGFLYTGEYVHSWLAATQYIAPLMANFDTSQMENATVKYADNGTTLVVEWANVFLQGSDGVYSEGPFTFQAILHEKGDIIFAYKSIPTSISTITDDDHPVKVGLSDAYIIERTIFFVRRKTIYEYHRVNMKNGLKNQEIASQTAIYLQALPRCNTKKTCRECLSLTVHDDGRDIQCMWCDKANLCSDGFDRNKQNWLKNCEKRHSYISGKLENCDSAGKRDYHDYTNPTYKTDDDQHNSVDDHDREEIGQDEDHEHFKDSKNKVHHTGVALLTIVIILVITICGWCLYAYFFPHTCSGQLLIKYRPSRWHWRRGEARYTAASIHM